MKKNDPSDDIETGKLPPYVEVYFENDLLYRGFLIDVVVEEQDKESSHYAVSCIHGEMLCVPLFDDRWSVHHLGTGDDKPTPWQLAKKEFDILLGILRPVLAASSIEVDRPPSSREK